MDTAIPTDVEQQEIETGNTERNEFVSGIVERAKQERDKELSDNNETVVNTEVQDEKEEVEEPVVEKPDTVKIKVDGEEREVQKDKVLDAGIRALQKESSADKRLEEATRLLREVQERIVPQANPSQEWDDATVAYAMEHGTEEQKAHAENLIKGRTATPEQIVQQVTNNVLDTVDFKDASQWFLSEYKDIIADPYLAQLAANEENRARANGDIRPRRELYKEIGDGLRKWRGGVELVEKQEKKSKIVNLPSASVKKTVAETETPKTPSDLVEDMRKARGQR